MWSIFKETFQSIEECFINKKEEIGLDNGRIIFKEGESFVNIWVVFKAT